MDKKTTEILARVERRLTQVEALLMAMPTMTTYQGFRVEMRTREENHINVPHIHLISPYGTDCSYDVNEMLFIEGEEPKKQIKRWLAAWVLKNRTILLQNWDALVKKKAGAKATYPLPPET